MTTLQEVDDALQAFELARIYAFAQLAKAHEVVVGLASLLTDSSNGSTDIEASPSLQENNRGGFAISGERIGIIVDMHGFSLHDVTGEGGIDKQRPREDVLRVLCNHILNHSGLPNSNLLYREAEKLSAFLGPIDNPFEKSKSNAPSTIAESIWDSYAEDDAFCEFVNREFEETAGYSTLEEMAEFAFGDIDAAIQKYEQYRSATDGDTALEEDQ